MSIPRRIEPEWLDDLPPDNPRALRSRRDLRRINVLMANAAIIDRELRRSFRAGSPRSIAEIGAGDGTLMLRLAESLGAQWPGVRVVLLDQQDIVSRATCEQFGSLGWLQPLTGYRCCSNRKAHRQFCEHHIFLLASPEHSVQFR